MSKGNLPHRGFERMPLNWGAEPGPDSPPGNNALPVPAAGPGVGDGRPASLTGAINAVSFSFNYTSGAINVAFPKAVKVASQGFTVPVGIVSVVLSTSMLNQTTDGVLGVFVAKDLGATSINILAATDLYVEHVVNFGLGHSMRSGMSYADDIAPKFGSGEAMAIYISSAGTGFASNRAVAVCTIRYFAIT